MRTIWQPNLLKWQIHNQTKLWYKRNGHQLRVRKGSVTYGQDANVCLSSKPDCAVPGRSLPSAWNIQRATNFDRVPSSWYSDCCLVSVAWLSPSDLWQPCYSRWCPRVRHCVRGYATPPVSFWHQTSFSVSPRPAHCSVHFSFSLFVLPFYTYYILCKIK